MKYRFRSVDKYDLHDLIVETSDQSYRTMYDKDWHSTAVVRQIFYTAHDNYKVGGEYVFNLRKASPIEDPHEYLKELV